MSHTGVVSTPETDRAVMAARARVLADLESTGVADPQAVSLLEEAVADRQWWVDQWAEGADFVVGLVAQDVQDALLEERGRWPLCAVCEREDPHSLHVSPDLGGPDPVWVCEDGGVVVAPIGELPSR